MKITKQTKLSDLTVGDLQVLVDYCWHNINIGNDAGRAIEKMFGVLSSAIATKVQESTEEE